MNVKRSTTFQAESLSQSEGNRIHLQFQHIWQSLVADGKSLETILV